MATIPDALAIAVQHHQSGRLQSAEQIYRQILAVEPNHADALHLLGVIAAQAGKHEVAVETIERAIRVQGNAAPFHNNLGEAYRALGRLSAAAAAYRRALELKPDYAEAHNNLGNALWRQGKLEEAAACYRRALALKPGYAEAHNNLGNALRDQGKLDEAVACYRRALELKPNYALAHSNLGNALKDQGKLDEAIACCRRALELNPNLAEAHGNLGGVLEDQGKPEEAAASYRRALALKPDFAKAHGNLGSALEQLGDLQGAEASFRAAVRHDPRFAFAHYKLADLLGGRIPETDLAALRRLLDEGPASGEQSALTDAQRSLLHFGLAQVLDARSQYAEAAEHLARANSLQRSERQRHGQEYDPQEHEYLVTRTIEVCTPDFFARARDFRLGDFGLGDFGLESEIPVFVVGLPRSGTTLIEQILAGHSQVFGAGELKFASESLTALGGPGGDALEGLRQVDRATARRLAARHLERLRELDPSALRIVDKMPDNYVFLGMLAVLFPRAKLIHCRRDVRDVAVSCWMTHFRDVRWANDQGHIASRFQQHQRIMEHWRKVLPTPLLDVDYEETVADLETVARRLVAWCGLEWEPGCLAFHQAKRPVKTASAVQVRQPVYTTSVARWRHYEQPLATLLAALTGQA